MFGIEKSNADFQIKKGKEIDWVFLFYCSNPSRVNKEKFHNETAAEIRIMVVGKCLGVV